MWQSLYELTTPLAYCLVTFILGLTCHLGLPIWLPLTSVLQPLFTHLFPGNLSSQFCRSSGCFRIGTVSIFFNSSKCNRTQLGTQLVCMVAVATAHSMTSSIPGPASILGAKDPQTSFSFHGHACHVLSMVTPVTRSFRAAAHRWPPGSGPAALK